MRCDDRLRARLKATKGGGREREKRRLRETLLSVWVAVERPGQNGQGEGGWMIFLRQAKKPLCELEPHDLKLVRAACSRGEW